MAERPVIVKAPAAGKATGGALGPRPVQDGLDIDAAGRSARATREERLARALRDNLRRRKAQARADRPDHGTAHEPPADGSASRG